MLSDLNDMGMLNPGDRLGLGHEPSDVVRTGVSAGQDHLEGARPVQADMARLVDDPHAAAAQLAADLVTRHRGHDPRCVLVVPGRRSHGDFQRIGHRTGLGVGKQPRSKVPQFRSPDRSISHLLQGLLTLGAITDMPVQFIELGIVEAMVQEPLEQVMLRAGIHSSFSSFRTSSWIIFLTSLLATYTRATVVSS